LAEVGFIHCSTRDQVEGVANTAYSDAGPLVLLTIDPDRVAAAIRQEPADDGESFPHIYGPLPTEAVVAVQPFAPGPGGLFVLVLDDVEVNLASSDRDLRQGFRGSYLRDGAAGSFGEVDLFEERGTTTI
jgi:uncharacterized protein (DUF952 family)